MFSTREIKKGCETRDWDFVDVHMKLSDMLSSVVSGVMSGDDYAYIFDEELFFNDSKVSNDVWKILDRLGYRVESFDNGDEYGGKGIKINW